MRFQYVPWPCLILRFVQFLGLSLPAPHLPWHKPTKHLWNVFFKMTRLSLPRRMGLEQGLICGSLSRAFPLT